MIYLCIPEIESLITEIVLKINTVRHIIDSTRPPDVFSLSIATGIFEKIRESARFQPISANFIISKVMESYLPLSEILISFKTNSIVEIYQTASLDISKDFDQRSHEGLLIKLPSPVLTIKHSLWIVNFLTLYPDC